MNGPLSEQHLADMTPQACPAGIHADWAVDSERDHACPWCRIAELEAQAAAANTTQITKLGQQLACRSFYLAESEDAEDGPTLHTTADAAKAWCDEVEPGEWFEDDGVWVQCDTDPDTDRPTTRGAGTVTPLTVQGDGIIAEAERIRQELLAAGAKVPVLTEVRDSQRDEIRRLQTEQGEVMKALGCDGVEEWDEVVHRARQLVGGGDR